MFAKKFGVYLPLFSLLIPVNLAVGLQSPFQNHQSLSERKIAQEPPAGEGRPSSGTASGGTRGGCPQDTERSLELTLLLPADGKGLTVTEHPSFFAFVPQTKASVGEFVLYDSTNEKIVYRTTFSLKAIPGIVRVQLPKDRPPLKVGSTYEWRFLLHCKPDDRSVDVVKVGKITRIAANEAIAKIENNTNPVERARVYIDNNIWYDSLKTLSELNVSDPGDSKAKDMWRQLLGSEKAKLNAIASYPLVNCCQPEK